MPTQETTSALDIEFVYAGEWYSGQSHLGTYWNLYFINNTGFVLDEVRFKSAVKRNVAPGERVLLRQHVVEIMWNTFWSEADYHVEILQEGTTHHLSTHISEDGRTATRMVRGEHADPLGAEDSMDPPVVRINAKLASKDQLEPIIAELQTFQPERDSRHNDYQPRTSDGNLTPMGTLAFHLQGFFMDKKNWENYDFLVAAEIQRRTPEATSEEIEKAMAEGRDGWVYLYFG